MKELNIDPEFKNLIDPLSPDELSLLEESLKKEGCRDSLVTWQGTLVDGHNRYKICRENNIQFSVVEKEFKDRNEAVIWIIKNQLGRRNTTPASRIKYALRLEDEIKKQARENQEKGINQYSLDQELGQASSKKTNKILGEISRTNEESVRIYKKVQKEGDEELKKDLDSGKITINKANTILKERMVDKEEAKEGNRYCVVCGKDRPLSEFKKGQTNECSDCKNQRSFLGITISEAKKLGGADDELDQILEQMKNPSPQECDNGIKENSVSPIISELQEILNTFRSNISKFNFMAETKGNSEVKNTIAKIINDLSKINSNIKEK